MIKCTVSVLVMYHSLALKVLVTICVHESIRSLFILTSAVDLVQYLTINTNANINTNINIKFNIILNI